MGVSQVGFCHSIIVFPGELDEVVQNLATGEIADSVREIASFRTKIKDIGSKVHDSLFVVIFSLNRPLGRFSL